METHDYHVWALSYFLVFLLVHVIEAYRDSESTMCFIKLSIFRLLLTFGMSAALTLIYLVMVKV